MADAVWTFRIVDEETGAPVAGVPVTLLDRSGGPLSYWVSDAEGLVAIPRQEPARLRLRVGLRSEEPIELDARGFGDSPIPLVAPRRAQPVAATHVVSVDPAFAPPTQSLPTGGAPAHVLRFTRIGVVARPGRDPGSPVDLTEFHAAELPAPLRYGVLLETEALWQSMGTEPGDLLYSVSLAPGDEARAVVLDGRWRRQSQRERPLQIVAKMIGVGGLGDGHDAVQLEPLALRDLASAAAETVGLLAERTVRVCANLRRRPLGVSEAKGDVPESDGVRTVRNARDDAVVTYHFVEPLERYRVVIRRPRTRPAILVPFRLPNLATREVVYRFRHLLRRAILDRTLLPDLEAVIAADRPLSESAERLYAHIASQLPYYSATFIAGGDPGERQLALSKLRDLAGRALTEVIENTVVGRVGNYVAFPLRSDTHLPEDLRTRMRETPGAALDRLTEDFRVLLPIPGVWIKSDATMPVEQGGRGQDEAETGRERRGRRLRG